MPRPNADIIETDAERRHRELVGALQYLQAQEEQRRAQLWTAAPPTAAPARIQQVASQPNRAMPVWAVEDRQTYQQTKRQLATRALPFIGKSIYGQVAENRQQQQRARELGIEPYTAPNMQQYNVPQTPVQERETRLYGRPLTPAEQSQLGESTGVGLGRLAELANKEVPGMRRVQQLAGKAGGLAAAGLVQATTPQVPGVDLPTERIPREIARGVGQWTAEALVPTRVWEVALELVPGVGSVPGLASAVRAGDRSAIRAVTKALDDPRAARALLAAELPRPGAGIVYSTLSPTESRGVLERTRKTPVWTTALGPERTKVQSIPGSQTHAFRIREGAEPVHSAQMTGVATYRAEDLIPLGQTPQEAIFEAAERGMATDLVADPRFTRIKERVLAQLERAALEETGSLKLPFGKKADEVVDAKPARVVFPKDVRDVLLRRGVDVKSAESKWQVLPEINRQFITDMAQTSVSNFDRKVLLAEGRQRQAQAVKDAATAAGMSFEERRKLAAEGLQGRILPEFQGIGRKYTVDQVKSLSDQIDEAYAQRRISPFQWKQAGDSFTRLLTGGRQLEPGEKKLLGRIFGPEFEGAIPSGRNWDLWRETIGVLGVPQALVSTLDISAVGRQMAPLGWAHPHEYVKAIGNIKRAAGSDAAAREIMEQLMAEPWMTNTPYPGSEGLSFSDVGGRLADIGGHLHEGEGQFSALNASLASRTVERLPWVKPSERVYNVPINVLRGKVYGIWAEKLWQSGVRDPAQYKAVADVIDHATGWGSFKAGEIVEGLNAFFSPRNLTARFQFLLDPIVQPGSLLKPSARQLAARNLVGFVAGNTVLLGAMAASGAVYAQQRGVPNPVHIELDPRSSDWGKGKIGNMRIDTTGGFGSIIRLVARLAPLAKGDMPQIKGGSGKVINAKVSELVDDFMRGKMGIVPGAVWDALGFPGGEQYKPNFSTAEGRRTFAYNSLTPFFVQDVVEAWRQEGPWAAAIAAPLAFSGLAVNTYQSPSVALDLAVREQYPQYKYYGDLPTDLRGEFDKANPDLIKAAQDARAEAGYDTFDQLRTASQTGLADLGGQLERGEIDRKTYRQDVGAFLRDQSERYQQAIAQADLDKREFKGDRRLLDDFYTTIDQATNPVTHQTDFDEQERLADEFRAGLPADQVERLDQMLGYSTDPTYTGLKADKQLLADTGYFDRSEAAWDEFQQRLGSRLPAVGQATTPQEFRKALEDRVAQQGLGPAHVDTLKEWKDWEKFLNEKNGRFLTETPDADAIAAVWGYQELVHSREAMAIYEKITGLRARRPAP